MLLLLKHAYKMCIGLKTQVKYLVGIMLFQVFYDLIFSIVYFAYSFLLLTKMI